MALNPRIQLTDFSFRVIHRGKQVTTEKVRTKFIKGFPIREWYKDQGVRNEALDRRVDCNSTTN